MMMCHEVQTIAGATPHWNIVEPQGIPNATMVHGILLKPSHQKGNPLSTKGSLRVVNELVQNWGEFHNLIGGSQVNSKKVTCLRKPPKQLEAPK
jgi:hypothetical protein